MTKLLLTSIAMAFGIAVAHSMPATQTPTELILDAAGNVRLSLVRIPAGKFMMGSPASERDREADETQHAVTISRPFYLGKMLVTVDQFSVFAQDTGYKTDAERTGSTTGFRIRDGKFEFVRGGATWQQPSFQQAGNHPVVHVSWNDAQAFCAWLSKKTGTTVVLPTEAQWEYAARAGTTTAYPWGDNPEDGQGWINGADQTLKAQLTNPPPEMEFFGWHDGFVFTSPVGSFRANAFGVYDMTGNVWQWINDLYEPYRAESAIDPAGAASGTRRILRGGSWMFHARYSRLAGYRNYQVPETSTGRDGFRIAVLPDGK